jgi:hypothetical protein
MKNSTPLTSILAFICLILISCESDVQKPDYTGVIGTTDAIKDFSGTWVATRITHVYGDESLELSGNILDIKICVFDYHSICLINGSDAWISTSKWGKDPDSYFGNKINQCSIQTRIIDSNPTELQVKIENLTPYLFKLCPEEKEDGYYLATFRRDNGLY